MIRHIVMMRLNGENEEARHQQALDIKAAIERINGKIPGLLRAVVGLDFSRMEDSYDIAYYAEFESREALDGYMVHPEHVKLMPYVRAMRSERAWVDCETDG